MQVTCPNCAARYAVDPLAIGPAGRTVQCARCHDRWFQTVERERPVPDLVIRPPSRAASSVGGNSLPAVIEPRLAFNRNRILAASGLALVAVLVVAVFVFRNDILGLLAGQWRQVLQSDASVISVQTANAAPVVAAPVTPAPAQPPAPPSIPAVAQLEIDFAASKIELVDDRYVVRGEIVNSGTAVGSIRSLKLVFKDRQDAVLGERSFALVRGPIAPGARLPFSQAFDDPPAGTTDVVPAID